MSDDKDFMDGLRKRHEELKEEFAQGGFTESKKLSPGIEPGKLYRFTITRAFGGQDNSSDNYGDWMGFEFDPDNSPVFEGYADDANVFFLRKGAMRTFVNRVLRIKETEENSPELTAGYGKDGSPIVLKVPKITEPLMVEFVMVEEEPKAGFNHGFRHIFGQPVDKFGKKWEDPAKFVENMQSEMKDYLESRNEQDDGEKIGHTDLGVNKLIKLTIIGAYAPKTTNDYMIFKVDTTSPMWDGYNPESDKVRNRLHLSGMTLKTFRTRVLRDLEDRDESPAIVCGKDSDGNDITVGVPKIPDGGINVKFFREEVHPGGDKRKKPYYPVLGEVVDSFE